VPTRSSLERCADPPRGSDGRVCAGHSSCTQCASRDSVARKKKRFINLYVMYISAFFSNGLFLGTPALSGRKHPCHSQPADPDRDDATAAQSSLEPTSLTAGTLTGSLGRVC